METIQEVDLLAELLALYRLQRHDVLNHFQVVMGYLQLNKNQAALDYLRQAAADIIAAAPLSRLKPARAAVELMLLSANCFKHDVAFGLKADSELPELNWTKDCSKFVALVAENIAGSARLDLNLTGVPDCVKLEIGLSGLNRSRQRDLAEAAVKFKAAILEDTPAGSIKFEFPC